MPSLVEDSVASRLFAQDATLWGPDAESESRSACSWVGLPRSSRPLVGEIAALRDRFAGAGPRPRRALRHGRVVARAGGHLRDGGQGRSSSSTRPTPTTSAAPSATTSTARSSSSRASPAPRSRPTRSAAPTSRRSPTPASTRRRASSSSPTRAARSTRSRAPSGYRVVNADPDVGGRYSALTAFGLVPSGLAGVDIEALLDEAESVADVLAADDDANPGLRLGAAMGGTDPLRDKLVLVDDGSGIVGFADWAEQLIAESTGKNGTGVLPVVVGGDEDPEVDLAGGRRHRRRVSSRADETSSPAGGSTPPSEVRVSGPLGAQLLLWEVATAVAGRLLGINPFDQPDVESAKKAARALLDQGTGASADPAATDGAIEIRALGGDGWLGDATHRRRRPRRAVRAARPRPRLRRRHGLPRPARRRRRSPTCGRRSRAAPSVRRRSAGARGSCTPPASSTRAARPIGVYLQITTAPAGGPRRSPAASSPSATSSPPRPAATPQVLADHGRPVLQLHLTDHDAGLAQLREALGWLGTRGRCMSPARVAHGHNPLRDPQDKRLPRIAGPCGLVLFGVTGDLARKKLMPAIYDLANRGLLPPGFSLVGFARRDWADQDFGQVVHDAVKQHARTPFREDVWRNLAEGFRFVPGTFDDPARLRPARRDGRTSSTRSAAPAATTPSTCRSRRASSPRSASSSSAPA